MSNSKLYLPPFPSDSVVRRSMKKVMLEEEQLGWSHWSVSSDGESFVNLLTECLWYHVSWQIPSLHAFDFQHLQGYHKPEASKHRHKDIGNLNAHILDAYTSSLNKLLLQPWFDMKGWNFMRSATMLETVWPNMLHTWRQTANAIKKHHAALTPVCSAADSESSCLIQRQRG